MRDASVENSSPSSTSAAARWPGWHRFPTSVSRFKANPVRGVPPQSRSLMIVNSATVYPDSAKVRNELSGGSGLFLGRSGEYRLIISKRHSTVALVHDALIVGSWHKADAR